MPFFLPSLKAKGHLERLEMTVCNVGSRKVEGEEDEDKIWHIFGSGLTIYGFDADPEACEAANQEFEAKQADWNEFHLPVAIAEKTETATLYITRHPMCSSLYPPNAAFLRQFEDLSVMELDRTTQIETTSLDEFCSSEGIEKLDFLHIDVQGADLQVLKGAKRLLDGVSAIQIEIGYAPMYIGQPLFSEVDQYLRTQGFSLFDISAARRPRSIIQSTKRSGQLLWGDALYLREAAQTPEGEFECPDQAFKLACIADALEFIDYSLALLKTLTLKHGRDSRYNFAEEILERLKQIPGLEESTDAIAFMTELEPFLSVLR